MRSLIFIILILISNVFGRGLTIENNIGCDVETNVVFVNGVFNPQEKAPSDVSKNISNIIDKSYFKIDNNLVINSSLISNSEVDVQFYHNKGSSLYLSDLKEAADQVIDEYLNRTIEDKKKVLEIEAYQYLSSLAFGSLDPVFASDIEIKLMLDETHKSTVQKIVNSNPRVSDVEGLYRKVYTENLALDRRVILVSHSQGNLFANEVTKKLEREDPEKLKFFGNVRLAPPTSKVNDANVSKITIDTDYVINGILGQPFNFYSEPLPWQKNISARESILYSALPILLGGKTIKVSKFDPMGHGVEPIYLNEDLIISPEKNGPFLNSSAEYFMKAMNSVSLAMESNCSKSIPVLNEKKDIEFSREQGSAFVRVSVPVIETGVTDLQLSGAINKIEEFEDLKYYIFVHSEKKESSTPIGGEFRFTLDTYNKSSARVSVLYNVLGKYKGKYHYVGAKDFIIDFCEKGSCCTKGVIEENGEVLCKQ